MRTAIAIVLCMAVAAWALPALADQPDTPEKAAKPGEPKKFKPPADDKKDDGKKDDGKHKFGAPKTAAGGPPRETKHFPEVTWLGSANLYVPLAYPDYNESSTVSRYGVNLDVLTFVYRWRQDSGIRIALADAGGLFYEKDKCTTGMCLQNVIFNGFGIGYERFFGKSETFVPSAYLQIGPAVVIENFSQQVANSDSAWSTKWGFDGELGGIMRYRPKGAEWGPFLQAKMNYFYYDGLGGNGIFGFGIGIGMEHTF